jgi:integrase
MTGKQYWFALRPPDAGHGFPLLVFDAEDRLHLPLTVFAREAGRRKAQGTARTYLYAVLPFFSYLAADVWQRRAGRRWDGPPAEIRLAVEDYLIDRLSCKVDEHRLGFQLVSRTGETPNTVRVFLSGLKCFYRVMRVQGCYPYDNPLVDRLAATLGAVLERLESPEAFPRMPERSGVVEPRSRRRLSDSYFRLAGREWVPQLVDDPTLPRRLRDGGRRLAGRRLRDECVTRLLFETGARVSEVTGLTLGDWVAKGTRTEATAFSKGSHGARVKTVRFTADTAKLLRRYVDGERRACDPRGLTLAAYRRLAQDRRVDLQAVPLFLSKRGTPLSPKTYRENYWNPACRAAGIDADVHQARHWYVTMCMREVYETARTAGEVERAKGDLIAYMGWRSGEETLKAYEHHFQAARAAAIQDRVHARMDRALKGQLETLARGTPGGAGAAPPPPSVAPADGPEEAALAFLERSLR